MTVSRRRFIAICAAAAMVPGRSAASVNPVRHWTGQAMGARASLTISGLDEVEFERLTLLVSAEIERLENIFSLYRANSHLTLLNMTGRLDNPPFEFVELLSLTASIHNITGGAFDPTIQPLWDLLARSKGNPDRHLLDAAQNTTGWEKVFFDTGNIAYEKPGMAMTLNGIAQGFVTDRVADLLRRHGLNDVLVSVGEIAARGTRENGKAWRIGISETEDGAPEETIQLKDRAIATSAPSGTLFDTAGTIGHLIDPRTGEPAARWRRVSVINPSAALADGLSTAFCVMSEAEIAATLRHAADSQVIAMDLDGNRLAIGL